MTTPAASTPAATNPDRDPDGKIAELRAAGVLVGGEGARFALRPVAYVPGALARFLAQRQS